MEPSERARRHIESRDQTSNVNESLLHGPWIYGSARLDRLNAEHEPMFHLALNEGQIHALIHGVVPDSVKEMARYCVDSV